MDAPGELLLVKITKERAYASFLEEMLFCSKWKRFNLQHRREEPFTHCCEDHQLLLLMLNFLLMIYNGAHSNRVQMTVSGNNADNCANIY